MKMSYSLQRLAARARNRAAQDWNDSASQSMFLTDWNAGDVSSCILSGTSTKSAFLRGINQYLFEV